jgi:hypothetical protein
MNDWSAVSLTTEYNYIELIKEALNNPEIFDSFRIHPYYTYIIGNGMSGNEINAYFDELKTNQIIMDKFEQIKLMDNIGGAPIEPIANTNCRNLKYMYTAMMIKKYFPSDIKDIIEIGVGYGGLCYIIGQYLDLNSYTLIDIPEVVSLAKLFLSKLPSLNIDFYKNPPYSLCISECAITELSDDIIYQYYEKYISQSNYLYIRLNYLDNYRLTRFMDIIKRDFKIEMIKDYPNANEAPNTILGWKK